MMGELCIYCRNISEVRYLEWEPRHILGGCRGRSVNTYIHTCIAFLYCREGGTSTKQKEKKREIIEQIILACY